MNKNLLHTMAAGLLLCAGLASCEMKEELWGGSESSETGFLDLGVAVNASQNVVTKADDGVSDDGEQTGSSVSAADFPVSIVSIDDPTYSKNFEHFSDLEDQNPIELPVGQYTVTSHSNLELLPQMSEPYYEGSVKELNVTKDITAEANVVCTMKNTRIQLAYSSDFTANFTEWTITMNDGSANILKFTGSTNNSANPAPVYWLISENVSQITINIKATNLAGDPINETRILTKPTGGNTEFWTGGDALTVTMNGVTPDPEDPNGVGSIDITVNVTFAEESEDVEVPVTPGTGGGDEPSPDPDPEPSEDAPTLSGEYLESPLVYSISSGSPFPEVEVAMDVPAGIASVWVKATSNNSDFAEATAALGLDTEPDGSNIMTNQQLVGVLPAIPEDGATSYSFKLGTLSSALLIFSGEHSFIVKVIDKNGEEATGTLKITITE